MDTRSKEYVKWMANVWKANHERNMKIQKEKEDLEKLVTVAEIEAGCYE